MRTKLRKIPAVLGLVLCLFLTLGVNAQAKTLDEILDYEVQADLYENAAVNLHYHIEWKVLDSSSEGPLEWVEIGIPNKHCETVEATAGCDIKSIKIQSGSYPSVRIDLNRKFYKDEVAIMDFTLVQNNLYQMNKFQDGYTVYDFTPGYFDEIEVDNLVIYWNNANVDSFTPSAEMDGAYLKWNTSLGKGERYSITVTYPNEAYGFNELHSNNGSDGYGTSGSNEISGIESFFTMLFGLICSLGPMAVIVFFVQRAVKAFKGGANFGSGTEKKVTRTLITYYPTCQGCGATREEDQTFCTYCGRSFIEKEETVTEENVAPENKDVLKYNTAGTFRYSSRPNTFVRVNVVNVPVVHRSSSSFTSSGSSRSSCAHSSCAHSSCACACACACAGGGRAGCTFKDFYNTGLKLRYLEYKNSKKK